MALYDDKWWLLSHIQNSFVMCDDSGNSELVFAASDRAFAADRAAHMAREEGTEEFLGSLTDYLQQDEQEAQVGSFEIRLGRNQVGYHRPRCNTEIKLEKMRRDRRNVPKVRTVNWREAQPAQRRPLTQEELDDFFPVAEVTDGNREVRSEGDESPEKDAPTASRQSDTKKRSLLAFQMEKLPQLPKNPFEVFSRFDAAGVSAKEKTRTLRVFLSMQENQDFPMQLSVVASAKVQEVIGFICWKYTGERREPVLKPNTDRYALYIADADGSIEMEFPALDRLEPISKFGFPVLGLVESYSSGGEGDDEAADGGAGADSPSDHRVTVYLPDGTFTVLEVETRNVALKKLMEMALERRRHSVGASNPRIQHTFLIEKKDVPGVPLDQESLLSGYETSEFYIVRANSRRRHETPTTPTTTSPSNAAEASSTSPSGAQAATPTSGSGGHLKLKQTFSVLEAPVGYREYREGVTLLTSKMRAKVDVVMALSEEKIEIYPKQQHASAKFWKRQKSLSYNTEALVACEVIEKRPNGKWVLRLVLVESEPKEGVGEKKADASGQQQQQQAESATGAVPSSSPHSSPSAYRVKRHDFECPEREAVEVHSKLNYLLAWQPSEARHWYLSSGEAGGEGGLKRGHSWHLK